MMIGLSLIPVAVDWFAGGQRGDANYATPEKFNDGKLCLSDRGRSRAMG